MAFQGITFDFGVAMHTKVDEDGFLVVQNDALGEQGSAPFPIFQPFGRIARPRSPVADSTGTAKEGSACTVLIGTDGSTGVCILGSDPRYVPRVPLPSEGSVGDYCVTDDERLPFWFFNGKDGTYQLYIPTPDGSSIEFTVGFEDADGLPKISMVHPDGSGITFYKQATVWFGPGGLTNITQRNGVIELNGIVKATALIAGKSPAMVMDPKLGPTPSTSLLG